MSQKVLVTGGTGYIGSHTIVDLLDNGFEVISIDNYYNSSPETLAQIESITGIAVHNYAIDLVDFDSVRAVFREHSDLVGIIHFAALKSVGESVERPLDYYDSNLNGLLNILRCAEAFDVANLIFSSSCSIYGNADELPVTESTPMKEAESPYARTKQIGEFILRDYTHSNVNFNAVALRYFNPAGAHESAKMGESPTNNASNLVPVITATAAGKREKVVVFGNDYDTRDGSCIRDYIHVMDLANAHTKAIQYLIQQRNENNYEVFNLGIGEGASVLEVIHAFEKVANQSLNYKIGPRRPGDVIAIYANKEHAMQRLSWQPTRSIEDIMRTAWAWEKVK